ncbi:MAG: tetratricopeptide repeat protein, partial [Planctomycetes bacterium]|nr:tetratricopeptide repeat protein [Planctomycetota bacterium]
AGECVAFTGTLASMTHRQAFAVAREHGGEATAHVSGRTTMLVVGEEGWPLESDGRPSQKLMQALAWNAAAVGREDGGWRMEDGAGVENRESPSSILHPPSSTADALELATPDRIRILTESQWLYLVGLDERRGEVHRQHTPAMLSRMLDVPVRVIRRWERLGLIRPVRRVRRLPYFDFQEVAGVRRLAQLLADGVPRERLEAGLEALQRWLGTDTPLVQLDLLARHAQLVYRDEAGLLEPATRQRLLDFDAGSADAADDEEANASEDESAAVIPLPCSGERPRNWSAAQWMAEGCRRLEEDDPQSAAEAFRLSAMERPNDPELQFLLAEALYRSGNLSGALERYYAAVEIEREYPEAWVQIGCIHRELGERTHAAGAFEIALELHVDFADAHFHLAGTLEDLGRHKQAREHWRAYLRYDRRGPWADLARQRLGEEDSRRDV